MVERLSSRPVEIIDSKALASTYIQRKGSVFISNDLLSMDPIDGVICVTGDFRSLRTHERIASTISQNVSGHSIRGSIDFILCDMLTNVSGNKDSDYEVAMNLNNLVLQFLPQCLSNGGDFLIKILQGPRDVDMKTRLLKLGFKEVVFIKPKASRKESREMYILARQFQQQLDE